MSKNTEENKEKLKEKLHYLGLNLEKIPTPSQYAISH